jgi:hypothetical protein
MPRLFGGRSLGSLGDDTLGAQPAIDDQAYKREMLELSRAQLAAHRTWADGDRFQKWLAIAATITIPLSAAIWKKFGVGRKRKP